MKKSRIFILIFTLFLGVSNIQRVQSQVVIALLFGDKLNSPNLKFGLDGGINFYSLTGNSNATFAYGFNLGLYFDIRLKQNSPWYIHTGLLLKSPMGCQSLKPYALNNPELDTMFANGNVKRELRYINLPLLVRYYIADQIFIEAGPMAGVLVKATDVFQTTAVEDNDVSYRNNIYKNTNLFDIGIMGGLGYHFMKGTGMNIGFRYYYGFISNPKDAAYGTGNNQSMYAFISIPIGAGEKSKAKAAAKAQKKQEKQQLQESGKE
jgi:hypothetical protein